MCRGAHQLLMSTRTAISTVALVMAPSQNLKTTAFFWTSYGGEQIISETSTGSGSKETRNSQKARKSSHMSGYYWSRMFGATGTYGQISLLQKLGKLWVSRRG